MNLSARFGLLLFKVIIRYEFANPKTAIKKTTKNQTISRTISIIILIIAAVGENILKNENILNQRRKTAIALSVTNKFL